MMSPDQEFYFKEFGTAGNPVVFFFTAFRTKYWWYYPTIKKLTKAGYHVIVYDVRNNAIFDGEVEKFLKLAIDVSSSVKTKINDYKKLGVKAFFSFGISMGTLMAMRVAIDNPEINKIVVNLTYGRLADNIWTWKVLSGVKKKIEAKGMDWSDLDNALESISPVQMASKLNNKKFLLYLSKKDKVIAFNQSLQFKQALDAAGVDYVYYQNNNFGHLISGALNNLRSKIYLDFLK